MAGKTVSFNTNCDLIESQLETLAKWMSCNGEVWGVGPTAVFASAAALFLYHELEASIFVAGGDQVHVSLLEKTLISTMVAGMLALMIHIWVCSMRFFQYYLDTLIRDSPSVLLEMTTVGLLGPQSEMVPLGPLTRFLRQQQPQIHITFCWFLSLCYADYVRKHYCQRFNMPYLEQWQTELQERASQGVNKTMERVNSFVGAVHQRLRGFAQTSSRPLSETHTVRAAHRGLTSTDPRVRCRGAGEAATPPWPRKTAASCASGWSVSRARPLQMPLKSSEHIYPPQDVPVAVHRTPASAMLAIQKKQRTLPDFPWRQMATLPFE